MQKTTFRLPAIKLFVLISVLTFNGCKNEKKEKDSFNVVFLTDVHLLPELDAVAGFTKALDTISILNPDFILTGGDLVMDASEQSYGRADSLYKLYQEVIEKVEIPVHNTMGNHDIYGIDRISGADPSNPEFGEKMFEKRMGPSYNSFEHKGWKFITINSIEVTKKGSYTGQVDSAQISWIKSELKKTDPSTPIVLSTHIPFITATTQKYKGSTFGNDSSIVIFNSKEVIDLFKGYNLKLVLQGHLHTLEDVYIDGIHFITGGAVSAAWWEGPHRGVEEGFVYLTFSKNDFLWKYIDYGWNTVKK
jgi:3',5'-cyclic-AMP phosphodiesterase